MANREVIVRVRMRYAECVSCRKGLGNWLTREIQCSEEGGPDGSTFTCYSFWPHEEGLVRANNDEHL